ncbi:hypothetical protein Cni_G13516 [Canna indica]|uniref:Pre-mRNA polyadenylation factor Fip1 domain-containing protein n=1 Tax=Canna indica TaxID=4628 RepID=A0AAQ3KA09_9LILI|nr:hypothetical protein Cni_G13516 [Canna indica]
MGSMQDDFGELYADLDDQVNAGLAAIKRSCSGKELGSISEEYCADGRVAEAGERPLNCGEVLEAADSESEDDLHIVLNEEDHLNLQTLERGNAGLGEGWCEEEEDEDLVIVTGSSHVKNNDQKRVEQLSNVDGLTYGSAKRGSAAKINCNGWCVQTQKGGFSAKSVISTFGKGGWDQLMICSDACGSCNSCILAEAKNGYSFSLPRKRTIFDIYIEALEPKPWRQQGVDITDYFNYDLNEESWKSYCQELAQFRQHAKISTQLSVNESSRLSQMSTENKCASLSAQCVYGERISSMDNLDSGLRRLEMRKGRAIQVAHGNGERIPSVDIRRPRPRDSDVVIQLTVKGSLEDCSTEEESRYSDKQDNDIIGLNYESRLHEGEFCLERDVQVCPPILSSFEMPRTSYNGTASAVATNLFYKVDGAEDPDNANTSILKAASPCTTQDNSKSSSDSGTLTRTSEDTGSSQRICNFVKKESASSVFILRESNKSECYNSDGSGSSTTKLQEKDWECHSYGLSLSPENYTDHNITRLNSKIATVAPAFREEGSVPLFRTSQNDNAMAGVACRREGGLDYGVRVWGHLSFEEKTKRSRSNKRSRHTETPLSRKASIKVSHRKGNNDTTHKINFIDRDCSRPKRVASYSDNGTNSEDFHLYEQYHREREIRGNPCEVFDESVLKSNSLLEKDKYLRHRKGTLDRHIRIKNGDNQKAVPHRCREQNLLVMQKRQIACFSGEEKNFSHKSNRYILGSARELKNLRRGRNEASSCIEMNRSTIDERGLLSANSPRDTFAHSLRSNEHYVDHKQPSAVEDERALYYDENVESTEFSALTRPQLRADDEAWLRHQEQLGLSTDEGSFYFIRNSRNEASHANKNFVGCSYSEDHVLVDGRKKINAEEDAAHDSREDIRFVLENFDNRRRELGTLKHREAVNLHVNGVKRKFPRRGNPDTRVSEGKNNAGYQGQRKAMSSRSNIGDHHQEVAYSLSKLDRRHQQPDSLDAVAHYKIEKPGELALKKFQDSKPISQDHGDDEIEEGQLIEELDDLDIDFLTKYQTPKEDICCSLAKPCLWTQVGKKNIQPHESTKNNNTVGGYDNKHIMDLLAKMEKRRERFKKPIATRQVEIKSLELQVDVTAITDEVKQHRPTRKRRWGASS